VLEDIGFLDQTMENGLYRRPVLYVFGSKYRPTFTGHRRL
jgi:hypothetical protein